MAQFSKQKVTEHKTYIGIHVKYPLFLYDFIQLEFPKHIFKKILIFQISRKSLQWEQSGSTQMDRHDKVSKFPILISHFSQFCEHDKKACMSIHYLIYMQC
jgi:hypothetical protein